MADSFQVCYDKHHKPYSSPLRANLKTLYRFEEENVLWFLGNSEKTPGGSLSPSQIMNICLRYLADSRYQKGVGEELGVEQSTVSKNVKCVINTINEQANDVIIFPSSPNAILNAKFLWESMYQFSTAIGVIDCTLTLAVKNLASMEMNIFTIKANLY